MFTIDMLKGRGLPEKRSPKGIMVGVLGLAVPVIIAIIVFGMYLSNAIAISVNRQEIANYRKKTDSLSKNMEEQKSFQRQKEAINAVLSEVSSSIDRHTQWSDVLVTVARSMPDSMVLDKLEAKQEFVKKRVPKKDDPDTKMEIIVPVRSLCIRVSGKSETDCDIAVRNFSEKLRVSDVLGPRLKNIGVSKYNVPEGRARDVVSYEIDCTFKEGL